MITTVAKLRSGHVWTCTVSNRMSSMLVFVVYCIGVPQEMQWVNSPGIFVDPFVQAILLGQKHFFSNTAYGAIKPYVLSMLWIPSHPYGQIFLHCELPSYVTRRLQDWSARNDELGATLESQTLYRISCWIWSIHGCYYMVWMSSRYQRNGKSRVKEGMVVRGYLKTWTYRSVFEVIISFFWAIWTTKLGSKWAGVSTLHSKHGKNSLAKKLCLGYSQAKAARQVPVPFSTIICDKFLWWFNNILPKSLPKELQKLTDEFDPWLLWRYRIRGKIARWRSMVSKN